MNQLLLILACVRGNIGPAPAAEEAPVEESTREFDRLIVHADPVDAALLRERLQLRLEGREVIVYREGARAEAGTAVLQVRPVGDELALSLVTPSGSAFFRTITVGSGQPERIIATTVANLISAIEARQVVPDREGVSAQQLLDAPAPSEDASAPPVQRPKAVEADEPKPRELATAPAVEPRPDAEPSTVEPAPEPTSAADDARAFELGIALVPGAVVGFGGAPVYRGVGGSVALSFVLRSGAMMRIGGRGLGQRSGEYVLGRGRVELGAGYDLRARAFEMPVTAGVSLEPWGVAHGSPRAVQGAPVPLFGGQVRLEPSWRFSPRGGRIALRLGLGLDLGVSAEMRSGVAVPTVRRTTDGPVLFRLGGAELGAGLVVEIRVRALRK